MAALQATFSVAHLAGSTRGQNTKDARLQSVATCRSVGKSTTGLSVKTFLAGHQSLRMRSTSVSASSRSNTIVASMVEVKTHPKLSELDMVPFISEKGRIMPAVIERAAATVFAVFNEAEEIQYIGFSKDIRNSLRTVLSRRPDQCHYFKTWDLDNLDQKRMLAARQDWISEVGSPPGLSPEEAKLWQEPLKLKSKTAAIAHSEEVFGKLEARGLKEDFSADPDTLVRGVYDILPSAFKTDAEMDADDARRKAIAESTFDVSLNIFDETVEYTIFFGSSIKTNGGWMFDVSVFYEDKETTHRVICGKEWPESVGMEAKEIVKFAFGYLIHKKIDRHTEGMMVSSQFPINYFSMSEIEQWYPEFATLFSKDSPEAYWRFNRIHDYGWEAAEDTLTQGHPILGPGFTDEDKSGEEKKAVDFVPLP